MPNREWEGNDQGEWKMEGVQKKMRKTFYFSSLRNPSTISGVQGAILWSASLLWFLFSSAARWWGDAPVTASYRSLGLQYELEARKGGRMGGWVGGWGQVGRGGGRIRQKDPGVGGQSSSSSRQTMESSSESDCADGNVGSWPRACVPAHRRSYGG